jgi:hypothetical protein
VRWSGCGEVDGVYFQARDLAARNPDLGLLLVRTDYSDDRAWHAALSAATAVYDMDDFERMGAFLRPVESPALADLTPEELAALAREDYLSQIAVADAQTMLDQTVLFVDFSELNGQVGRTFRSIPSEVEPIVANLSLANMDFAVRSSRCTSIDNSPDQWIALDA